MDLNKEQIVLWKMQVSVRNRLQHALVLGKRCVILHRLSERGVCKYLDPLALRVYLHPMLTCSPSEGPVLHSVHLVANDISNPVIYSLCLFVFD